MRQIVRSLYVLVVVATASAQDNPISKCSTDDWGKYLITTKNETDPSMSVKDNPQWRVVSNVGDDFVRIDSYTLFSGNRVGAGGSLAYFKEGFEPIFGLSKSADVQVVSTSKEMLTVRAKKYSCTKIVRKIVQPLDESAGQASWKGTSTIWVSNDLPLALAKMENAYETKLDKSDKGQKIVETWMLADFGFKNWK